MSNERRAVEAAPALPLLCAPATVCGCCCCL